MLGHYLRYMLYSKPHIFIGGLMMRKVDLRMNELKKYEIIKKLVETNGNKKRAAIKLGCSGVLQLNNINFFETLDIALFFCQFFCIFHSYFLVLCDIIVSGGVSYG